MEKQLREQQKLQQEEIEKLQRQIDEFVVDNKSSTDKLTVSQLSSSHQKQLSDLTTMIKGSYENDLNQVLNDLSEAFNTTHTNHTSSLTNTLVDSNNNKEELNSIVQIEEKLKKNFENKIV